MTQTVEELVGRRIRDAREALGLTQAQLGEGLGDWLGKPWTRQAVSTAEKGGRDFRAVELVALSQVLSVGVGWLTDPISDDVELPSGKVLRPRDWVGWGYKSAAEWRDESLYNFLLSLDHGVGVITDMVLRASDGLIEVREAIDRALGVDEEGEEE